MGCPAVEISALKGTGLEEAVALAIETAKHGRNIPHHIFSGEVEHTLAHIEEAAVHGMPADRQRWYAIKIFERDEKVLEELKLDPAILSHIEEDIKETEKLLDDDAEAIIINERYNYITSILHGCFKRKHVGKLSTSEKIDKVVTNRIAALPIFAAIMFLVYYISVSTVGTFVTDFMNDGLFGEGFDFFGHWVNGIPVLVEAGLTAAGTPVWLNSLILDGIVGGVGAVLGFVPQILVLFIMLAFLEACGYMSRIAFILDRAFKKFGLSGRAFIPMLTGFGCSVPAIMATRTLGDDREKRLTIRLMTCFSCGAKAPIWAFLAGIGAMMGAAGDIFVFAIYLGGIAAAVIFALFLKLFSKEHYVAPFVMELPEYHLPQARNVLALLWDKLKHYVVKACTIILACTIVIWFFSNFGWDFWYNNAFNESLHDATFSFGGDVYPYFVEVMNEEGEMELAYNMEWSILGTLGQGLKFFFYPLGCLEGGWTYGADGWKYSVATITGLIAKEDVVATMAVLGLDEGTVALNAAGAYSFAAYNLFTIPCFAAIGAAHGELKGKHFWLTLLWWFAMSYVVALIIYWVGAAYVFAWWLGLIVTLVLVGAIVGCGIIVSKRQKEALAVRA
jgi:ferrous iron transport protein B